MKKIVLMLLLVASLWSEDFSQSQKDKLAFAIRSFGYSCDTIDIARVNRLDRSFTVVCNGYKYEYVLRDVGGRWTIEVK